MNYADAVLIVKNIHEQSGDHTGFKSLRELFNKTIPKYKSFDEWLNDISHRSDLSGDDVQMLYDFDDSVKAIYLLMDIK